ncbi:DUF732 domain-containing protein [Streptomyces bauhiniae]
MQKQLIAACAVIVAVLITGCTTGDSKDSHNSDATPDHVRPSVANFVGRTKGDAQAALSGTGTVFGFQDAQSNLRSDHAYDSWIVCKQDDDSEPVWFTVAAGREACGLPASSPSGPGISPTSSSPEAVDPSSHEDSRYAVAVKAQVPKLKSVSDDNLGVQGRLACTLLDAGDSPKSVVETMQAAYPDEAGRVIVIEAPRIYCPQHTAELKRTLE